MPALTACQLQCRMDEAELFYDCIMGCHGNMICDYRCQLARAVYIARCDASCNDCPVTCDSSQCGCGTYPNCTPTGTKTCTDCNGNPAPSQPC